MASGVSFSPELRPISGTGIVPIKIKNPRGGLITILEIDPSKTTVGELKQMLQKQSTFKGRSLLQRCLPSPLPSISPFLTLMLSSRSQIHSRKTALHI